MQDTGDQLPALCSQLSYCQVTVTAHWYLFQLWWAPRQQYVPWSESRKPQSVVSHHHQCSLVRLHALTYLHAFVQALQDQKRFISPVSHLTFSVLFQLYVTFARQLDCWELGFTLRTPGLILILDYDGPISRGKVATNGILVVTKKKKEHQQRRSL